MDRENAGSNLVFFLLGAAVGAAVALLYAPQEGAETRRLIGEKATEARDKASEVGQNVTQTAKEKLSTVRERGQEYIEKGQEFVRKAAKKTDDTLEDAQAALEK